MRSVSTPNEDEIEWSLRPFSELGLNCLYDILALRAQVFVVEQNCVYADLDELDRLPGNRHVIGRCDNTICAYARSLAPVTLAGGSATSVDSRIGRVVVHPSWRRRGLGSTMLGLLLDDLTSRHPASAVRLDAQLDAEHMYASAGFVRISDVFLEDGIEHVRMRKA